MLDKNGVELQAGCVVEITGAYFKSDNGFWFVEKAPGDPSWCGSDCCLKKISKTGKVSKAKHNICFWPIGIFISDRCKAAEAHRWNKEHAQIEVKAIQNMAEVAAHFEGLAEVAEERIFWTIRHFGEDHPEVGQLENLKAHYKAVIESILQPEGKDTNSYFYTFGSDPAFPFQNGWVVVKATSREEADEKFRTRFPDRPGHEGIMNYAFCYNEKRWAEMDPEHTWPGWKLHEIIE